MPILLESNNEQEWLEQRRLCVTATEAAKLAQSWANALEITKTKNGESKFNGNAYTDWGKQREPIIAEHVRELFPTAKHNDKLWIHSQTAMYGATPDMIGYKDDGTPAYVVEIKTVGSTTLGKYKDWPHELYYLQTQWQMFVMDVDFCIFAWETRDGTPDSGFTPGESQVTVINRDEEAIARLKEAADRFIGEYFFGEDERGNPALADLLQELQSIQAKIDPLHERANVIRNMISEQIGDDPNSYDYGFAKVTRSKASTRKTFDHKRFAKEHPEMELDDYYKQSTSAGRMTITFSGSDD